MRKSVLTLLATAAVALLCVATSPARAEYELSVFGSPYWAPDETDEVAGGGLSFDIPITSNWQVDLRGSYFEETSPDAFGEALEIGDADSPFRENGLEVLPLEVGGRYNFLPESKVRPYAGAGVGYYMLDTDLGDVNDEGGYYGLVGLGFGDPEKANFFVEANYRRMEATVEVDPDTIADFEGFDEDVGIDLDGLGFNVGVSFRVGG
jgi:outer membrane protein W